MEEKIEKATGMYVKGLKEITPNKLIGVYLTGSIALNDYIEGKSDIDFTTVLKERLSENEIYQIKNLHMNIEKYFKKLIFEGHYITERCVGQNR